MASRVVGGVYKEEEPTEGRRRRPPLSMVCGSWSDTARLENDAEPAGTGRGARGLGELLLRKGCRLVVHVVIVVVAVVVG